MTSSFLLGKGQFEVRRKSIVIGISAHRATTFSATRTPLILTFFLILSIVLKIVWRKQGILIRLTYLTKINMSLTLLVTSFLAGILTVLAPCVLSLLPVIVGGSLIDKNKWRPVIISVSLAVSVVVFTLLLKFFTLFIAVPQIFWTYVSGGIVIFFGLTLVFPSAWDWISVKLKLSQGSEGMLAKAEGKNSVWGAILLGAALGPVFSSCSPTYFVILATVLPVSLGLGIVYLLVYAVGLALILILISILGRALTSKLKFAANPRGWFKRILGILLLVVGIAVVTGVDKVVQEAILNAGFGVTTIERDLLKDVDKENRQEITTPVVSELQAKVDLPNYGKAPEFVGLENWINSNPLTLAELKGKVVMVDFWTYSCINCIRTLPYLETWQKNYADKGLVIIGIHDPEFQFEKDFNNVKKAVADRGLTYPVVQDNEHETWDAYKNQYWPAKYIIDKDGYLRYYHFGEGNYEETEEVIQELLGMKTELASDKVVAEVGAKFAITPETYLGLARRDNIVADGVKLARDQWSINDNWSQSDDRERIVTKDGATLKMNFYASTANLVLGGKGKAKIMVDGKPLMEGTGEDVKDGVLTVDGERLYRLTNFGSDYKEHLIEITFENAGMDAYAWTFG